MARIILVSYGLAIIVIAGGNRVGLLTVLRELRIRGIGVWRTLLVGDGLRAGNALHHLSVHPELGLCVCGLLKAEAGDNAAASGAIRVAGTFSRLRDVVDQDRIEAVLLAPEEAEERQLGRMLKVLRDFGVRNFISAEQYPLLIGQVKPTHVHGHPLVEIRPEVLSVVERFLKRAVDLVVSAIMLLLTLPLWVLLAILLPLDSPGPVIFRQQRVGLNGRVFTLYKFRSMRRDAEAQTGAVLAVERDPRVTRIGRLLRSTHLDEIPQFVNVLLGQMSLVGPRPERVEFVERFVEEIPLYERRLNVKPGLTGWSQVHLKYDRGADEIPIKLKYDFYYIENMSLPLDMKIMFMTFFVMLRGEGL